MPVNTRKGVKRTAPVIVPETPEVAAQRPRTSPSPLIASAFEAFLASSSPSWDTRALQEVERELGERTATLKCTEEALAFCREEVAVLRDRVNTLVEEASDALKDKRRLAQMVMDAKRAVAVERKQGGEAFANVREEAAKAKAEAADAKKEAAMAQAEAASAKQEAAKAKDEAAAAKQETCDLQRVVDALCPVFSPGQSDVANVPMAPPPPAPPLPPPLPQAAAAADVQAAAAKWPEARLKVDRCDNAQVKALGAKGRSKHGHFSHWIKPAGLDPAPFAKWL